MLRKFMKAGLWMFMALSLMAISASGLLASTLDDIIKRGTIRIGVGNDVPPFGSLAVNGKLQGYDIDFAHMIAKDLGVKVKLFPTTGINRVPYLITNKVDLIINIFGANPSRAQSVSFSIPYAPFYIGIFGPKNLPVKNAKDTSGYKVGLSRGTTMDLTFTPMAPKDTKIIRYEDDATSLQAYLTGRVDMIATGNLLALEYSKKRPGKFALKFLLRISPGHIGVRRHEPDLLQWVNTAIYYHKLNGDLNKLSLKWFGEPLPVLPTF